MSTARRTARLTQRGTAAVIGGAFVLALGSVLRIGELLAIGAAGMVLPCIAWLRVRRWASRSEIEAEVGHEPSRVIRGLPVSISATIKNRGRRSVVLQASVRAEFVQAPPRGTVRIVRGGSALLSSTSEAWRRGKHRIGPVDIELGDGAGLAFAAWSEPVHSETLVLPAFVPVEGAPTLPPEERAGGSTRRSPMRGTEFHGLREYQRGDDMRQIHWRASAKHGSLLIKELELLALPRFTVILDNRRLAFSDAANFELAISTAASLIAGLGRRGYGVKLVAADARSGDHGYGAAETDRLIERLALLEPAPITTMVEAIRRSVPAGRGGGVILVGPTNLDQASVDTAKVAGSRFGFCAALLIGPRSDGSAANQLMSQGWAVNLMNPTGNDAFDRRVPGEAWRRLLERAR